MTNKENKWLDINSAVGGRFGGGWDKDSILSQPPLCVHDGVKVGVLGKVHLYAGRAADISVYEYDYIIDASGTIPLDGAFATCVDSDLAKQLNTRIKWAKVIRLAWRDYDAPPLGAAFWRALLAQVQGKACVCCTGGHGRTGTILACLAAASGVKRPLQWVRHRYCSKAVETAAQEQLVAAVVAAVRHAKAGQAKRSR